MSIFPRNRNEFYSYKNGSPFILSQSSKSVRFRAARGYIMGMTARIGANLSAGYTMQKFRLRYGYSSVLFYAALFLAMLFLNFTMDSFEPFSLALYAAMLACGLNVFASAGLFLLSGGISLAEGFAPFAVYAAECLLLGAVFFFYARAKRPMRAEIALWLLPAAGIFIWVFGQFVYADYIRSLIVGAVIYVLCFVMTGALRCALFRAGRCRLTAEELVFSDTAVAAAGIGFYKLAGTYAYEGAAIFILLIALATLKNANVFYCALVLSLPEAIAGSAAAGEAVLAPVAVFAAYAGAGLAFLRAGKLPAALAVFLTDVILRYVLHYLGSVPASGFYLALLTSLVPCFVFALLPEKLLGKWSQKLKTYGEKQLTRLTINAERSLAGERLFDIAAVFREIENAFTALDSASETEDGALKAMEESLFGSVCAECENRQRCEETGMGEAIEKLVNIGAGKGKATLLDLPAKLAAECVNASGLLFCLNKLLAEYRRHTVELENAALGRRLLADQARCVSEMLKELAVNEARPFAPDAEKERRLKALLARSGVVCQEAMVTDECVSLTAAGNYETKRILRAAESVFAPAVLAKKRALAADKYYYEFRKKPAFDAAFGSALAKKEGESASGDTYSVLKIDEKTFLLALSDGMGSGEYARKISDCTVSLVESFYRAKMPPALILETVNRLLSFNKEESFACIDIAAVDLSEGYADIVKVGSPLGFVLSENKIEVLESDSLPLGILDGVKPTTMRKKLSDGDALLFISDGVTDAFGSSADIADFLASLSPRNPQALCDSLITEALARSGGAKDDMTAVAARLFLSSENESAE